MEIFNPADTFLIGTKLANLMLIFPATKEQTSETTIRIPVGSLGNHRETNKSKSYMKQQHVLRDYSKMSDGNLGEFGLAIGGRLSSNPLFASLSALGGKITAKATEFNTAVAISATGSATDTAHKNTVRGELIALLNTGADGVDAIAAGNVETLTASGYHLSSPGGNGPAAVGTVSIAGLTNVASGKLGLNLTITGNVWAVVVESQTAPNVWAKVAVFTDLNNTVMTGLTPGASYTFRVCAMAAANQVSEWSAPITGICT